MDETQTANWFWDEGKPGEGDRPEWLSPKYTNVIEQAKAQRELEKKLGAMQVQKPPENYSFEDLGYKDYDEFVHSKLVPVAKEIGLNQEQFSKVTNQFLDSLNSALPDKDEEMGKLGADAEVRTQKIANWALDNLSEKALSTLNTVSNRAEVVEMVEEFMSLLQGNTSMPPEKLGEGANENAVTRDLAYWKNEVSANYAKYKSDSNYRAMIESNIAALVNKK